MGLFGRRKEETSNVKIECPYCHHKFLKSQGTREPSKIKKIGGFLARESQQRAMIRASKGPMLSIFEGEKSEVICPNCNMKLQ